MNRQLVFACLIVCAVAGVYSIYSGGGISAKGAQPISTSAIFAKWVGRYPSDDNPGAFPTSGKSLWEQSQVTSEMNHMIGRQRFNVLTTEFTVMTSVETKGSWVYLDVAEPHEFTRNEAQFFANPTTGEIDVCWTETAHSVGAVTQNIWFGNRHPPFKLNDGGCEVRPADQELQLIDKYHNLQSDQVSPATEAMEQSSGRTTADYRMQVGECAYQYLLNSGGVTLRCGDVVRHSDVMSFAATAPVVFGRDFQDDCLEVATMIRGTSEALRCLGR